MCLVSLPEMRCAQCRNCCVFSESSLWELPASRSFSDDRQNGMRVCADLGSNGCRLGEKRPLECRIWPLRLMRNADGTVLWTVARGCSAYSEAFAERLVKLLDEGLEKQILRLLPEHPEIILPFQGDYRILRPLAWPA